MKKLPTDPMILLSYVNTRLRDFYPSLEELCAAEDTDMAALESALRDAGYIYSPDRNRFVSYPIR